MHSGFFQSLLDSGAIGTLLYISIIIGAVVAMIRYDRLRAYPSVFFTVVFLAVANFGETVIFTAGTFPSVYFWYLAVFAFALRYQPAPAKSLAGATSKRAVSH
jgi:hypothetical protein